MKRCDTGRHYQFTEWADHAWQCFLFLPYHALKLKEMIEKLFYTYEKEHDMNFHHLLLQLFLCFFTSHQTKPKWPRIHPSLHCFFSGFLRCFSPPGNIKIYNHNNTQWKQGTVKCLGVTFCKDFFGDESKPLPQIFQRGGKQKQDINKKQLQSVTWFCLLFPIYIN